MIYSTKKEVAYAMWTTSNFLFVCRAAVTEYLIITDRIGVFLTSVAGITFYCVNSATLHFFYDSRVVGITIKSVGCPIEENNHSFLWLLCIVEPFSFGLKPINTGIAYGVFWDKVVFYIFALVGTPGNEAGAPFDTGTKTVPAPIRLTSNITELFLSYLDYVTIRA